MDTTNASQNFLQWVNHETKIFQQKLDEIWDQIGVDTEVRQKRIKIVSTHVKDMYTDVLAEAQEEQKHLLESIELLLKEMDKLQKELHIRNAFSAYENVPFIKVKMDLETKIKTHRETLAKKQSEIKNLLSREKTLCQALGQKRKLLPISPIPSEDQIESFKLYLEELSNEKFIREEKFLLTKANLLEMINELKIKPSLDFEKVVLFGDDSAFVVTDENMLLLENFFCSLKSMRGSLRSEVRELREKLCTLWLRLEENPQYTSEFTEKYPGFSVPTCNAIKTEIHRCESKVKENIKIFVEKMRHEIRVLWENCRFGPREKAEFIHYTSDCFTEDLLTLHELQIEKLKQHFNNNKEIYDLILKRENLWEKMLDLERRANEPNRFKNRGGQLLKEEKERNSVRAQLPKIEKQILILVEGYENEVGLPFKIDGELVTNKIAMDWESHKENRHLQLSAKKQAREQKTPQKSPRSVLSHITSALKPATPNKKSPTKRKLVAHLFGSSSAKKTKQVTKNIPKIQVNGSTIRRVSLEREKRLEKRRRSRAGKQKTNEELEVTDYTGFQMDLETKPTCRSTLFLDDDVANENKTPKKNTTTAGSTTPRSLRRTPSRTYLLSKSPHLTSAPGQLPILF